MSGFGSGPFGSGPFGNSPWGEIVLFGLIPDTYKIQDVDAGGKLQAFIEGVAPSLDYLRQKIADLDSLRDPLLAPTDKEFSRNVEILQVDDLGDGTSRVFLSQGQDGSRLNNLRAGYVLTDSSANQFEIISINISGQPSDFDSVPIDPWTGNQTGKNVIVNNISLSSQGVIPLVSGTQIAKENPTPTPLDNGSNTGIFTFVVVFTPLAKNVVTVTWTESGDLKTGYFLSTGKYFGDIGVGSSINYTNGSVALGIEGTPDADSIRITYTTALAYRENPTPTPPDNGLNVGPLVFLAKYPPLAAHIIRLDWYELGVPVVGYFSSIGVPSGGLSGGSTVNFLTGSFSITTASSAPIDSDTLRITYLSETVVPPEDAIITSQNILAFLGADYGATIDRHDPESLQRSFVYNAYQLWDLKGTELGYKIMGQLSGFDVEADNLYKISYSNSTQIDPAHVFSYVGLEVLDEAPDTIHIVPFDDGSALGPFSIQLLNFPIYQLSNITITWIESGSPKSVYFDDTDTLQGADVSSISASSVNRALGTLSLTFVSGHAPDAASLKFTYFPIAFYTDLAPKTIIMDDVILDVAPLDLYCFSDDYPTVVQNVDIIDVSLVGAAIQQTYLVTVDTSVWVDSHQSFGTEGVLIDPASNQFPVIDYVRISATEYQFKVITPTAPITGTGAIRWNVLKDIGDIVTDNPGTTTGTTISPAENGSTTGPFSIQLANYPLWQSPDLIITWSESSAAKTATLSGTSTLSGTNAANISSATVSRSFGTLTMTFAGGHPPDTDSIRITYSPRSDLIINGVGSDVEILGTQYFGFTGIRYRLTKSFIDRLAIGNVGDWKIIDSGGVSSFIEKVTQVTFVSPYQYTIEWINTAPPSIGPANIYYSCVLLVSCNYCAASVIRFTIRTGDVLNHPDALTENAYARLQMKLAQMVPAHVRVAEYSFFTGPTSASIPFSATSTSDY